MDRKEIKKKSLILRSVLLLFLLLSARWLLGQDAMVFWKWWIAVWLLGAAIWPFEKFMFSGFLDQGWMISKGVGIAFSGFLVWVLANCKLTVFTPWGTRILTLILACFLWGIHFWKRKKGKQQQMDTRTLLYGMDGELIFTLFFLLWSYFAGFRPAAYGTEKFMDYGFMMTMMRSDTLPALDMWYAGEGLNYYYGGQYFAVFLTKLTGTRVNETYNLMRAFVAGFAFVLPFVLVRQMLMDKKEEKPSCLMSTLGGVAAGIGVSFSGNMHYVVVGKLVSWSQILFGVPKIDYTYWFPNSTRFIGYYPAGNDKTIHEFPSYSFVLGDLHAHVVNLLFVLLVICLSYQMIQKEMKRDREGKTSKELICEALFDPQIWLFAFFIGLFHWTNYWDFVIYYVMGGMGVIYCNYLRTAHIEEKGKRYGWTVGLSIIHAGIVFVTAKIFALPFTLQFKTMVMGIALAKNHSRPYQWWLIWGLQVAVTLLFFCYILEIKYKDKTKGKAPDSFGIILGISALGLILIPEVVYVRDIYEKEFARSNTMFKLTYQAFVLFAILMVYTFFILWKRKHHTIQKIIVSLCLICFAGCCCYGMTAIHSWYGQVSKKSHYRGLDATGFLESSFAQDAAGIRWLNENIEGSPVVLEANGDSYSDYNRVSAMTGLPTLMGWYVHEWLWRGDLEGINQRDLDLDAIYTMNDRDHVKELLKQYQVEYIFVGSKEREKYPFLNEQELQKFGKIVFWDDTSGTYIIHVKQE